MLMSARSDSGLMAFSFTDTNGNFSMGVNAEQWHLGIDEMGLISRGYVAWQNSTNVTAGQTGITIAVPKGNAMFYGSVKDALDNPVPGMDVFANDNYWQYEADGYSDANGNYWVAVAGRLEQ